MKRFVFLFLAIVALIAGSTAIGLRLTPYVAKTMGFAPFKQTAIEGDGCVPALKQLIANGGHDIVLGAEGINNRTILEALKAARDGGIQVGVVLSGANPDNLAQDGTFHGARAWLEDRKIPCYISETPIRGFILVVDKQRVALAAFPVLSSGDFSSQHAKVFVFDHKPTAETYFAMVAGYASHSNGNSR